MRTIAAVLQWASKKHSSMPTKYRVWAPMTRRHVRCATDVGRSAPQRAAEMAQQFCFRLERVEGRNAQSQQEEDHADGKNAIGETGQPVDARAGPIVVGVLRVGDVGHV